VSSSAVSKVGTSSASILVYSTIVAGVACNNRNGIGTLGTIHYSKVLSTSVDRHVCVLEAQESTNSKQ